MLDKLVSALQNAKGLGVTGIYHQTSPHGCRYPNIVYSVISDVPALYADNQELQSRMTVRIHIITKDGDYSAISKQINKIVLDLGFVRVQSTEFFEDGLKIKASDYRIGVDL